MSRYLAFDIGGTKIATGFVTLETGASPRVEAVHTVPTEAVRGGNDVLRRIVALAAARIDESDDITAVGIGSAGVVDPDTGTIVSSTDLMPDWAGQPLGAAVAAATGLPVAVVNDVVAHGLGEAVHGAGRGYARVLSVGVGTGIGGALIEDGRAVPGAHGVAGHIGHIVHGLGQGVRCSCGTQCGHVEPVASGTGIGTLYNLKKPAGAAPASDGKAVAELAAAGDPYATQILAMSARALGEALGGAANLLDPDAIVISGSVVRSGDVWWHALREGFADGAMALTAPTPLLDGRLGGDAPLVGAAVAASRRTDPACPAHP